MTSLVLTSAKKQSTTPNPTVSFKRLKNPRAGWRNPTVRDKRIIEAISLNPGLTPLEIAQKADAYPFQVNDTILHTMLARQMAEQGYVCLPIRGRRPAWFFLLINGKQIKRKKREVQFEEVHFEGIVPDPIKETLGYLMGLIRETNLHVSPRILRNLNDQILQSIGQISLVQTYDQLEIEKLGRKVKELENMTVAQLISMKA